MFRTASIAFSLVLLSLTAAFANHKIVPVTAPTIQAGILASADGDTVLVLPGTYTENINFSGHSVLVRSMAGPDSTFIAPADPNVTTVTAATGEQSPAGIMGFTIRNSGLSTTVAVACLGFSVTDNIFYDNIPSVTNPLTVIRVEGPAEIAYNTFYNNHGINCIYASDSCRIVNNTFDHNARGVYSTDPRTILVNNIVTNCTEYTVVGDYGLADYNLIWPGGQRSTTGEHGFVEDPDFVNAAGHDYRLDYLSLCIESGSPEPAYAPPGGGPPNIGAHGYGGSLVLPLPVRMLAGGNLLMRMPDSLPTFSWHFFEPGSTQTAYQIECGTDNNWTSAELWTSGEVGSSDTVAAYGGPPLAYGAVYFLRMRVHDGVSWGAWVEREMTMNGLPPAPMALYPLDSASTSVSSTGMGAETVADPDGDTLWYDFTIYADSNLTMPVFTALDVETRLPYTKSPICTILDDGKTYWWRCLVHDRYGGGVYSEPHMFVTHSTPTVLDAPARFARIQGALENAADFDTILVAPGTYSENLNTVNRKVVLRSSAGREVTILQAENTGWNVIAVESTTDSLPLIDGFTIRGTMYAPGVLQNGGILQNCDINTCRSHDGAGVRTGSQHAVVRNCLIHDNTATIFGGGVYVNRGRVEGCRIYNNQAEYGQGISIAYGATVIGNLIYNHHGSTETAAAISAGSAPVELYNNTIVGNTYGVVLQDGSEAKVWSNIIAFNEQLGYKDTYNQASLQNNDLYGNGLGDDHFDWHGISADPMFVDTAAHDYSLQISSPCIDAGGPASLGLDPDGTPRDIGAIPYLFAQPLAINVNLGSENMRHVIDSVPTFYWSILDSLSRPQTRFDLEVGPDPEADPLSLWQTGVVNTPDTSIQWGAIGSAGGLHDGDTNYYRIRIDVGDGFGPWRFGAFMMNIPPEVPIPLSPGDGDSVGAAGVSLAVDSVGNVDADTVWYDFEVFADTLADTPLVAFERVGYPHEPRTFVSTITILEPDRMYYWRSRAWDAHEYSDWCAWQSVYVRGSSVSLHVPGDYPTIQAALDAAAPYDTVEVAAGTYTGPGNRDLSYGWKGDITLFAPAGATATILDAGGSAAEPHRVVTGENGRESDLIFIGLTFRNAYADSAGGAVLGYRNNAPLYFRYCVFQNNHAGDGGAIACAQVDLWQCRFENNSAASAGGALFCSGSGTAGGCLFTDNSAEYGGVTGGAGSIDFSDCEFTGNTGQNGAVCGGSFVGHEFRRCLFNGNQGTLVYAGDAGGFAFYNCTIVNNSGTVALLYEGSIAYHDCIVASNGGAAASCPRKWPDYPYIGTASAEYSCIYGNGGDFTGCLTDDADTNGNFSLDPQFCDPTGDFRLRATSPCAGAASDGGYIGAFAIGCQPTDVNDGEPAVPYRFALQQNHPNPFNPSTVIQYSLEKRSEVRLRVFNILGEVVAELVTGRQAAGEYSVEWNGINRAGRPVASGVYFYRIEAGEFTASKKMLLLK